MKNTYLSIRQYFYETLHRNIGVSSIIFDGTIAMLIIISVSITPLLFFDYFSEIHSLIYIIELYILGIFTFEYIIRIWSAEKKIAYIFSTSAIINLFSVLPMYIYIYMDIYNIMNTNYMLILILLRYIRVFKLFYIYKNERDLVSENVKKKSIHGTFQVQEKEHIITIVQKHSVIFFLSLFPVLILTFSTITVPILIHEYTISIPIAIFLLSISIFIFIKNWIDFNYDVIYVTNKRLVIQDKHIFGVTRNSIPYRSITNINPDSYGIQNSLLNSGNITIDTGSTSREKITFHHVENMSYAMQAILAADNNSQQEAKKQKNKRILKEKKAVIDHEKNKKHVHTLDFKYSSQHIQNHVLKKILNILLNK